MFAREGHHFLFQRDSHCPAFFCKCAGNTDFGVRLVTLQTRTNIIADIDISNID